MSGHVSALLRHVAGHSIGRNPHGINEAAAAAWLVEVAQLKARHVCVRESLKKNVSTPHVGSAARARLPQSRSDPAAPLLPLSHGQAFISLSEPEFPLLSPPEGNQQLAAALQRAFRPGRDTFIFIYYTSLLRLLLAGELGNVCVGGLARERKRLQRK